MAVSWSVSQTQETRPALGCTHHSGLVGQVAEVSLVSEEVGVRLNGLEVSLAQVEKAGEETLLCMGDVMRMKKQGFVLRQNKRSKFYCIHRRLIASAVASSPLVPRLPIPLVAYRRVNTVFITSQAEDECFQRIILLEI